MQEILRKTRLIFMMPEMTDFARKVMFSLSLFVSFLVWQTAGSSSLVAVAGCDGRSDKKELQGSIQWIYIKWPLTYCLTYFLIYLLKQPGKENIRFNLVRGDSPPSDVSSDSRSKFCRTWRQPCFTLTAVCWRMSLFLSLFLSTPSPTWSFPHISLFHGAQVRVKTVTCEVSKQR